MTTESTIKPIFDFDNAIEILNRGKAAHLALEWINAVKNGEATAAAFSLGIHWGGALPAGKAASDYMYKAFAEHGQGELLAAMRNLAEADLDMADTMLMAIRRMP